MSSDLEVYLMGQVHLNGPRVPSGPKVVPNGPGASKIYPIKEGKNLNLN